MAYNIPSTSSITSSTKDEDTYSFTSDDTNSEDYNNRRSPSPVSETTSDTTSTSSSNTNKRLKEFIEGSLEKFQEDDKMRQIRYKMSIAKLHETDESTWNLGYRIYDMLYYNSKKPKVQQNKILKNTKYIKSEDLNKLFENITGDDIVSSIRHRNITAIVYTYIAGKLDRCYRDKDNNNYLHIGVEVNDILTMKALLLLIEDSDELLIEVNNNGECPIDLVKSDEMRRIILEYSSEKKTLSDMAPDQRFRIAMVEEMTSKKIENITKDSKILASLDGGGIRGLCTIQIFMAIQKRMKNNLWENIDWVSGTSTGGILGILLSLNYSLHDVRKAYLRIKNEVFVSYFRPYRSDNVERLLQKLMSENKGMDTIKNKKLFVTTIKNDSNTKEFSLKLFRNYKLVEDNNNNSNRVKFNNEDFYYDDPSRNALWRAARATSAAPWYFYPFGEYLDGGILSNNPSMDLLTEYFQYSFLNELNSNGKSTKKSIDNLCCFISFGTGSKQNGVEDVIEHDLEEAVAIEKTYVKNVCSVLKQGLSAIYKILESDGVPVSRASNWCNSIEVPYFRLQPSLESAYDLDEKDDSRIINMLWECENHIKNVLYYEIELLARYLDAIIDVRNSCKENDNQK